MKISKTDFDGTGKVFRFTLTQYAKSKANIISFVLLLIICLASAPLSSLFQADSAGAIGDIMIESEMPEKLYIENSTTLPITCQKEDLVSLGFTDTAIETSSENVMGQRDVCVRFSEENGGIKSEIILGDNTSLGDNTITLLMSLCQKMITDARCQALGISGDALLQMGSLPSLQIEDASDYLTDADDDDDFTTQFVLQYAYSILVMMLTLLSATYIIRAVIEEKSSKLVELLMVSVKPLALLAGKILAMMLTVFVTLASMVGALIASNLLSVRFLGTPGFGEMLSSFGMDFSKLNLDFTTILLTVIGVFIAYLTYAVLSGIAGSSCSAMEDADSANTLVVLLTITGYMVSCIAATATFPFFSHFTALCPVISAFCAPVQYALGNISLPVFLLSLAMQAAIALLLMGFCAKVYRALLIHRGKRVKWSQLFKIAKGGNVK